MIYPATLSSVVDQWQMVAKAEIEKISAHCNYTGHTEHLFDLSANTTRYPSSEEIRKSRRLPSVIEKNLRTVIVHGLAADFDLIAEGFVSLFLQRINYNNIVFVFTFYFPMCLEQ